MRSFGAEGKAVVSRRPKRWLVNVKGEADGWILEHNMRSVARAVRDPFVIVGEVMAELTWLWLPTCRVQRSQALSAGNPSGCH